MGTSELILDRAEGSEVKVLGVIFQHSPLDLITLKSSGIDTIHKLASKSVMVEHSSAELFAYLRCEGVTKQAITIRDHTFDTNDLVNKKVDAMSVYVTDEPFVLESEGIAYNLFTPRMCGIDFYGDKVLVEMSARFSEAIRESDYVGRLAGDEFLIVLQNINNREDAEAVAEKVRKLVSEPCHIDNLLINTSASIGVSLYPEDSVDLDELKSKSDKAMYKEKALHKSQ